ncbi:MAG: tetratricopeptide repeat protein [Bellilinea sp.]|jgi:predicted ATPase/DNA-binding SARP family transcriptional activator/Tfp pilus assembly protein PilF
MPVLNITCFGHFQTRKDGELIRNFDTDKTRALLAYLAVERDRVHTRSRLAGLLWSDQPEDQALHNLRQTLSYLRKALGETPNAPVFLQVERDTIGLNPTASVQVDVHIFESKLKSALRYYPQPDGRRRFNPLHLQAAIDIHHEPFLDQMVLEGSPLFEEWAMLMREQLVQCCVEGLSVLATYYERRCEYTLARQIISRIINLTPWEESAHAEMMRLLAVDGHRSAAQNQYLLLRRFLSEHLGVEPSHQTKTLFDAIHSGLGVMSKPAATRHNLPREGLPFVGRHTELTELADALIDPENRLITLLGPGGVGKTRLALEAARLQIGVFSDGVFFVPLRKTCAPEQLINALAEASDFKFTEQQSPQAQITNFLRRKNLLLVLDNFEQLLANPENAALLAHLLAETTSVTFFVTSRERLNLREESIIPLQGLSLPDRLETENQVNQSEALALFLRRARQVNHNFELDQKTLPAAIQICHLLDGLPLGIELAAAALYRCTCDELAQALMQDLDILQSSAINTPPQHASLRAVFEVSWQLLTAEERSVFEKLALFHGGFSLEAALQIACAKKDTLDALVAKSLLRKGADDRYDLHETLRQYALEKLSINAAEKEAAENRHTTYYVDLLDKMRASIKGSGQIETLDQLQCELDNAHLAWNRSIAARDGKSLENCAETLYQFFNIRSRFAEGVAWFSAAVSALEDSPANEFPRAVLLSRQGSLFQRLRQHDHAMRALSRSQAILSKREDLSELGFCLIGLGGVRLRLKDFASALDCSRQAQEMCKRANNPDGYSYALYLEGLILNRMGDFDAATPLVEHAVITASQSGNPRRSIAPLNLLGDIASIRGDYPAAERIFSEVAETCRKLRDQYNLGIVINNLATVYHLTGRYSLAQQAYEESLSICREQGDRDGEALAMNNLGELAVARGRFEEAAVLSQQALTIAEEIGEEWTIVVCLLNLGEAASGAGHYALAMDYYRRAASLAMEINSSDHTARIAVNAARALQCNGNENAAVALLQAALAHPATEQVEREKAIGWLSEMKISAQSGEDERLLDQAVYTYLLNEAN